MGNCAVNVSLASHFGGFCEVSSMEITGRGKSSLPVGDLRHHRGRSRPSHLNGPHPGILVVTASSTDYYSWSLCIVPLWNTGPAHTVVSASPALHEHTSFLETRHTSMEYQPWDPIDQSLISRQEAPCHSVSSQQPAASHNTVIGHFSFTKLFRIIPSVTKKERRPGLSCAVYQITNSPIPPAGHIPFPVLGLLGIVLAIVSAKSASQAMPSQISGPSRLCPYGALP